MCGFSVLFDCFILLISSFERMDYRQNNDRRNAQTKVEAVGEKLDVFD